MAAQYITHRASTFYNDGLSNTREATETGSSNNIDLKKRHVTEEGIALLGKNLAGSDHMAGNSAGGAGEQVPKIPFKWQIDPFENLDEEKEVNEEQTSGDDESWAGTYNVGNFVDNLNYQGDCSVAATNNFFITTYEGANDEIRRVAVDGYDTLVVNDLSASIHDTEPEHGYEEEFGEKTKSPDNEDELEGIVEDYVEEELF